MLLPPSIFFSSRLDRTSGAGYHLVMLSLLDYLPPYTAQHGVWFGIKKVLAETTSIDELPEGQPTFVEVVIDDFSPNNLEFR